MDKSTCDRFQELKLVDRKKLEVSGVSEVVRFDDNFAVLKTVCGELSIDGKNIKISVLDTEKGLVMLDGDIDAISYTDDAKPEKNGLFSRLFS